MVALRRHRPHVVVLDYALTRGDGLSACFVSSSTRVHRASSRLRAEDLPILGMLFARIRAEDIAATLGVELRDVRARALRIIGEMQAKDRRGHAAV